MKTLYIFLLLIFLVSGQTVLPVTSIPIQQVRAISSSATPVIWIVLPNGNAAVADLGTGIRIDTSGLRPVLRVDIPAPSIKVFGLGLTGSGTGNRTFTLPAAPIAGTVRVYLNGIRQKETVDYTLSGSAISFLVTWDMTANKDSVLVDFERLP